MRTKVTDDDNFQYVRASLNTQEQEDSQFKGSDPFNKNWEELKEYSGLDQNFRRRIVRQISKAVSPTAAYLDSANAVPSGVDAGSKALNPGTVYRNGYGLFDVITPPYNMYELANFYDTCFSNHAAIDAKVENIVGLGYRFDVTDRTSLRLETSEDEAATGRARSRIERAKIELRDWLENLNDDDSFTKIMEKVYTDVEATGNGFIEVGRTTAGEIGYVGHIPATTVRIRRLRDGFVQIIGQKVVYFRNFGAKNANPMGTDPRPNEIIHLKEYSPLNTFYGIPDIIAAQTALAGNEFSGRYTLSRFQKAESDKELQLVQGDEGISLN